MTSIRSSPHVVAVFVVKFDVRKGNTVIWSKCRSDELAEQGIEFRAIPSGLHSSRSDVIYFVHPHRHQLLDGIAIFRQFRKRPNDRSSLQMYSIGVLCSRSPLQHNMVSSSASSNISESSSSLSTSEATSNKAWVFRDILSSLAQDFMSRDENDIIRFHALDQFYDRFSVETAVRPSVEVPAAHPLSAVKRMLVIYGPLVLEIWKAVLLRQRVILLNADESVETMCHFVYALSILAAIPSDASSLVVPESLRRHAGVTALYSISLPDASWMDEIESYVATTRDSVLLDKKDLYDIAVITQNGRTKILTSPDFSSPRYATGRSRRKFSALAEALGIHEHVVSNSSYAQMFGDRIGGVMDTASAICSQAAITGFLWWASAGEQSNDEADVDVEGLPLLHGGMSSADYLGIQRPGTSADSIVPDTGNKEPIEVVALGYFHQMARRMFRTAASIIEAQDYVADDTDTLLLDPTDLRRMGLDAKAPCDKEFAVVFVNRWFKRGAKVIEGAWVVCCGY